MAGLVSQFDFLLWKMTMKRVANCPFEFKDMNRGIIDDIEALDELDAKGYPIDNFEISWTLQKALAMDPSNPGFTVSGRKGCGNMVWWRTGGKIADEKPLILRILLRDPAHPGCIVLETFHEVGCLVKVYESDGDELDWHRAPAQLIKPLNGEPAKVVLSEEVTYHVSLPDKSYSMTIDVTSRDSTLASLAWEELDKHFAAADATEVMEGLEI